MKRVCIIGAGVAGLTSIKHCLEEDMEPVCYEKDTDIGGLWNYHENPRDGDPSLYNSCHTNSSKEMSCFSDFPIPKEFPNFMGHKHFKIYLDMYSANFKLKQYIYFQHRIEKVESVNKRWKVSVKDLVSNITMVEIFDFVMVCNGHLHEPNIPTFPGIRHFIGKVLHTHDYKSFHGLEGNKVLVIGIGSSGTDVACELSRHAKHVYISTRSGRYIRSRTAEYGVPFDHTVVTRFNETIPRGLMSAIQYHKLNYRFKHTYYGLAPNCKFTDSGQTISDELPNRIICGTISIKTKIRNIGEKDVIFDDGSKIENVDVIILATGYRISFPFLDNSIMQVHDQFPYLYKFVFPVQFGTLAVIGLIRPFGGLPPIIEMQARWACAVFSNKCSLPLTGDRQHFVEDWGRYLKKRYGEHAYSTPRLRVYFIEYVDELASMIGCKPNIWKYFFTDFQFWRKIYFGPATPPQWRLSGPGKWSGARKAIEQLERNTIYPMQTRQSGRGERDGLYDAWLKLLAFLFSLFLVLFIMTFEI